MHGAYHSPGKERQQYKVLMLDTQINPRPALAALLSCTWICLVALNHGHLNLRKHLFLLLFLSGQLHVYNIQSFSEMC